MRSTKQLLIAAKKRIEDPSRWTQGAVARDKNGELVMSSDSRAVCFCAMGAIALESYSEEDSTFAQMEIFKAMHPFTGAGIATFNDSHTHDEVLQAFDRAIAKASDVSRP